MAHLLSSTILRGMLEVSLQEKKKLLKTLKHKDTIYDAGSSWNINHQKMGKYINKVPLALLHPSVACSWTQNSKVQDRCFYVLR